MIFTQSSILGIVLIAIIFFSMPTYSDHLSDSINVETAINKASIQSQKKLMG
ncbi:MAG: hypothetical protein KAT04_02860 [Methylococcales bacterium]|nr:hypothetical protein [Methylococcales bacterium]